MGNSAPRPSMTAWVPCLTTSALPMGMSAGFGLDRDAGTVAARIADGDRAVVMQRGEHHVGELVLVGRRHMWTMFGMQRR